MLVLLLDLLSLSLSLSLSSLSLPLMSNLVQVTQTTVVSHASTWKNISLLCCLRYLYCLCCVPLLSVSLPLSPFSLSCFLQLLRVLAERVSADLRESLLHPLHPFPFSPFTSFLCEGCCDGEPHLGREERQCGERPDRARGSHPVRTCSNQRAPPRCVVCRSC